MATERNPADHPTATYDYTGGPVEDPALEADLGALVDGDVRLDAYTRTLYATDASAYEVVPIGVVFPQSTDDVSRVVTYCAEREIPVLPRGGGTSLAGQTVNRAIVLDFTRYMDEILEVDPENGLATVEPGTVLGDLNRALAGHGLKFAPDPAWADKSAIGGAIGNNSTGAHSLRYGKTDAYIETCEAVLADGTVTRLGECTLEELTERGDPDGSIEEAIYAAVDRILEEGADAIEAAYPRLKRNVSGYNLDRLVAEARGNGLPGEDSTGDPGSVNLARLLAGSEGTLAIVTEVTVSLEPVPSAKAVTMLCYPDRAAAMADVAPILEHDPDAVEILDDVLLDLARGHDEFEAVVRRLPSGTGATLLVEFYADDAADGRAKVQGLLEDRCSDRTPSGTERIEEMRPQSGQMAPNPDEPVRAFDAIEAYDREDRLELWNLRKSGLPILLSRTSDAKHFAFIEDTAVSPEKLPDFVAGFEAILDEHDTYASFYAHAGPGVLHVRPLLNTKTEAGMEALRATTAAVADLVLEMGGSMSGEHGDGRARTQWNEKLYGETVYELFRALKAGFDPDWILNPGMVCGPRPADGSGDANTDDGNSDDSHSDDGHSGDGYTPAESTDADPTSVALDRDLRYDPSYSFEAGFEPTLEWDNENGFQGMVELCHGCGGCRGDQATVGGVMCPTYRASQEEITSTRGRANALRAAMNGTLPPETAFDPEFVEEVLSLCIGCKGCAMDCPSGVDMAKLKAELTHEYRSRHGASLRDRLFANVHTLSAWGSRLAPLSNAMSAVPGARWIGERTLGIDASRPLPTFERGTFEKRFAPHRGSEIDSGRPESAPSTDRRALILPDTVTNYTNPDAGMAAVTVLRACGVTVDVPPISGDTGRPAYSLGFLDVARERANAIVEALAPHVDDGWDVVVVEPSDAVMMQSEYRYLLGGEAANAVADATYGVCEYVDRFGLADHVTFGPVSSSSLTYHGHCHQKASGTAGHAAAVLERAGYRVDELDSGCCGMAGSFGYEAEHASMSDAIRDVLTAQVAASDGERVVASGASCRTQLSSRSPTAEIPPTPIELVADAIALSDTVE